MTQVAFIAPLMEFLGAITAGAKVASTIQKGVIKTSLFNKKEGLLMVGMVCALVASATWLQIANSNGWPVSTTHSIVGGGASRAVCSPPSPGRRH
jgi:phosphate/sulfate permease